MLSKINSPDRIRAELEEVTDVTNTWMRTNILKDDYGPMSSILEHAITSVVPASDRALLVRYGCELTGRDWHDALPAMAAFEFQNINLLVTDDYFDDRMTHRMGKDPINRKWGSKAAIALGFVLKSLSNESLLLGWKRNPDWNIEEAIETIEWASKWQYYSQFLEDQMSAMLLSDITIDQYRNLIEKATAVGIAGALELGCIIGKCDAATRVNAREFGMTLGCLLQVRDDCIDYIYNEDLIRKGPFSDLFTKRRRLPILCAYWQGTRTEKRMIDRILAEREISLEEAKAILDLIIAPKSRNRLWQFSQELANEARRQIRSLPKDKNTHASLIELISLFSDL